MKLFVTSRKLDIGTQMKDVLGMLNSISGPGVITQVKEEEIEK